jgi:MFS family permease
MTPGSEPEGLPDPFTVGESLPIPLPDGRRSGLSRLRHRAGRNLPPSGPQRALIASVLVSTTGGGMMMGTSTFYLTRIIGMSVNTVGFGLSAGAALGLLAGPFVGHLADRRGPREILVATMLTGAVATSGFVLVRSFWELMLVSLLIALVASASAASRAPLVRALAGARYTWFLSYLRATMNVGIMLGALIAAIGFQLDSGPVYVTLILVTAVCSVGAAILLARLPRVAPLPVPANHRRWLAFTDRPYLSVTLLNSAMALHLAIPVFALPLWIVNYTEIPRAAVTGVIVVNGLMVVALQVRVSRGVVSPRSAGQRMLAASVALLGSVTLIAVTGQFSRWTATLVLLAAVVVYTFGELWHAAASFELAYGLARPHAQGQYAGVFGLGQGAANAAAPAILAPLCLGMGAPGWLALGGLLLFVGLLTPATVGWAERSLLSSRAVTDPAETPASEVPALGS